MSCASYNPAATQACQATGFRPRQHNSLGVAGLILSIVGVVLTCGLLCPVGLLFSLVALRKRPRGEALAGVVIGGLGTLAVASVVGFFVLLGTAAATASRQAENRAATGMALEAAEEAIEEYRYHHKALPEGIEGNKLVIPFTDAWGTAVRYEPEEDTYRIRSAGADTEFDTDDDVLASPRFDEALAQ